MLILVQPVSAANAQSNEGGCRLEREAGSNRRILRCERGLTIIAEPGARFDLVDRNGDGKADGVNLRRRAILVDAPRPAVAGGFQVITPQAIAAVRGTRWAVDVGRGRASVLVVEGRVGVRRPSASAGVTLGPGQGVDVEAGTGPLTVRRWPAARAAALLARLGQ
ncbi:MAG TPA: FecR domain-containing protein [Rhizobiaceae bacterium]|nr:FecR domain-containing protein [Rhizobiaceae bacterium]